jgi:hypothetical protein
MDPILIDMLEPVVVFGTLLGIAFGVKFLLFGNDPNRRGRRAPESPELERRVALLEERWEQLSELIMRQTNEIEAHDERLGFAKHTHPRAEESKTLGNRESP